MAPSGPSLHIQTKEKSRVWPFSVEQGPLQSLVKRTAAVFREKEKCLLCPPGSAVGRCAPRCSHWQFGWLFCTQAPGLPRPPRRGWAGHSGGLQPRARDERASVHSPQSSGSDGVPQRVGRTRPPCTPPAFILPVPPQAPYLPSILSPTPLSGWRKGPQCLLSPCPAQGALNTPLPPPGLNLHQSPTSRPF